MAEPSYKQHIILEQIMDSGEFKTGDEDDIEQYWELVRGGYLKNLITMNGKYEWVFRRTSKGDEYLASVGI